MRVRILVSMAGPTLNLSPGDEHEFPDAEALRLIKAEYAVPVDARPPKETAMLPNLGIERRSSKRKARGDAQRED